MRPCLAARACGVTPSPRLASGQVKSSKKQRQESRAWLSSAANPYGQDMWEETRSAAVALRIEPQLFAVRELRELAGTFATMKRTGTDAVVVLLATEHRLPAMCDSREYVEAGALIAYGPNAIEVTRRLATCPDMTLRQVQRIRD
jgi:hypothetical protein